MHVRRPAVKLSVPESFLPSRPKGRARLVSARTLTSLGGLARHTRLPAAQVNDDGERETTTTTTLSSTLHSTDYTILVYYTLPGLILTL